MQVEFSDYTKLGIVSCSACREKGRKGMGWGKVKSGSATSRWYTSENNEAVGLGTQFGWVALLQQLAKRSGASCVLKNFGSLSLLIKGDHEP